jgi:hypothetical protein
MSTSKRMTLSAVTITTEIVPDTLVAALVAPFHIEVSS